MRALLQPSKGEPPQERFVVLVFQPIFDDDNKVWGIFVEGADVTERVQVEQRHKLLLDELNHRVKNTLATVQAIAEQTIRTHPERDDFRATFQARLLALSATHSLLTTSSWSSAPLMEILLTELRPHGSKRYSLSGPEVHFIPQQALNLGMVFHELTTNAVKYGALSCEEGRVQVHWSVADNETGDKTLSLVWSEQAGPPASPPARHGFGSRLIKMTVEAEKGGRIVMDYRPEGLHCEIRMPVRAR
jgi:two-component sensor histidine kinase